MLTGLHRCVALPGFGAPCQGGLQGYTVGGGGEGRNTQSPLNKYLYLQNMAQFLLDIFMTPFVSSFFCFPFPYFSFQELAVIL